MAGKKECTFEQFVAELNDQEREILVKLWAEQSVNEHDPKKNDEVKKVIEEKPDR